MLQLLGTLENLEIAKSMQAADQKQKYKLDWHGGWGQLSGAVANLQTVLRTPK